MDELEELKERREKVRELLDKTIEYLKGERGPRFRDYQIFMEVYGDTPEMHTKFAEFSNEIANCPAKVMSWCKRSLNPKTTRNQTQGRGTRFVMKRGRLCRVRVVQGAEYAFRTK